MVVTSNAEARARAGSFADGQQPRAGLGALLQGGIPSCHAAPVFTCAMRPVSRRFACPRVDGHALVFPDPAMASVQPLETAPVRLHRASDFGNSRIIRMGVGPLLVQPGGHFVLVKCAGKFFTGNRLLRVSGFGVPDDRGCRTDGCAGVHCFRRRNDVPVGLDSPRKQTHEATGQTGEAIVGSGKAQRAPLDFGQCSKLIAPRAGDRKLAEQPPAIFRR